MMKMLLRDMTFAELAAVLQRHSECTSAPHLVDPLAIRRARQTAKRNSLWDQLRSELNPKLEIPVFKRSVFRRWLREGDRRSSEIVASERSMELDKAALALWLKHPKADLDYLQDLLWAYCDDYTWVMAAHDYAVNDLGSTMRAARLAEIVFALSDQIEDEVKERVHAEVERRVFKEVIDYHNTEFWHTAKMNWNHVCNGAVIRAALLIIEDHRQLAKFIHPMIQNMTYALDGFTDDGGCEEGASYWGFGFGHFLQAAYALHCRTGGELNIMSDPKCERISRFPLASHIDGLHRTGFADASNGPVALFSALQVNHFYAIPELYELCAREVGRLPKNKGVAEPRHFEKFVSGEPKGAGRLDARDMHSLALYQGQKAKGKPDNQDYALTDLGMVKMRGADGNDQMTVAMLGGHNGVPHNHNDIGSFQVFVRGRMALTDPGGPLYNKQTFRGDRYAILWCRSRGHSVPLINGREQKAGKQYYASITVDGLNRSNKKRVMLDMSNAYPQGTVKKLIRTFALDADANELSVSDSYVFAETPKSLEEAFVTFEEVSVLNKGKAVRIGPVRGGVTIRSAQAGAFAVNLEKEDPKHTPTGRPDLQRITFVPANLSKAFELSFVMK
jgi:hypothetical protein